MQQLDHSPLSSVTQTKRPVTVRIASWSARHRWLVFSLWFVSTIGLFLVGNLWGTKVQTFTDESDIYSFLESGKAWTVFNADGSVPAPQTLVIAITHPTLKVSDPAFKAIVTEITAGLRAATYSDKGQSIPTFNQIVDYYSAGLLVPGLAAKDGSATRIIATMSGKPEEQAAKLKSVSEMLGRLKAVHPDFSIVSLNTALLLDELLKVISHDLDSSAKITLPATFIILLITFGAVVAAFVPLILAVTALLGAFGLLAIYSNLVSPVDFSTSQLIVLIGLAVGIDYSLFMITRYRTERRHGREKLAAIEVSSSTAGRAVFFSGLIVMISLAGLFLMGDNSYNAVAVGTISVVLVSVIGSLTFLPATLAILGNGLNWGRIPYFGRDREEGSGFWASLVGQVMRRPLVFVLVTLGLLLALTYPFLQMKIGVNGLDAYPETVEGVRAIKVMNEKWPEGVTLKLYVFVTQADQPETKAALAKFQTAALQLNGLSGPSEVVSSGGGKVSYATFFMAGTRSSDANKNLVNQLRSELIPAHFGNLKEVNAYVSGEAAYSVDVIKLYADKTPLVIGFVLAFSFLILLIAFHSLIIPLKAILLNFLSLGASYGVMVLVFQEGWFSEQIGFKATGLIESFLPLFMFTILFGLSMDYHLLILTRIKEAKDRGANSNDAVAKGISVTSGTITSAAAIMVVVFAVFVTLSLISVRQLGLGLAVAVFIDATIIRSVLLPATMRLLGDWNWYMPKFLDWIPQVTIEAEADELPATTSEKETEAVAS